MQNKSRWNLFIYYSFVHWCSSRQFNQFGWLLKKKPNSSSYLLHIPHHFWILQLCSRVSTIIISLWFDRWLWWVVCFIISNEKNRRMYEINTNDCLCKLHSQCIKPFYRFDSTVCDVMCECVWVWCIFDCIYQSWCEKYINLSMALNKKSWSTEMRFACGWMRYYFEIEMYLTMNLLLHVCKRISSNWICYEPWAHVFIVHSKHVLSS